MNKLFKQLFVLIMIILFVGCTKDEHNNVFILQAEGFQQDKTSQKAGVSGSHTYWLDGDMVSINGMACSVSVTNNNEAVAYGIMTNDRHEYMAVYPAHVRVSNIGTSHIINVPKYYVYAENNGCQVLDGIPLVAYHIGEQDPDTMKFRHVTAAITVRVKNERSNDIELDRIELINDQYRLCGNITIDISECAHGGTPTVLPDKIGVSDTVTIYFTNGTKHIAGGSYADIQIPMIPVGTDNSNFTINVYGHMHGSRFPYNRSTGTRDNSIGRACMGYAVARYTDTSRVDDLFDAETIIVDGQPLKFFGIGTIDELVNLSKAMDSLWTTHDGAGSYNTSNYIVINDIDMQGTKLTPIHYYNLNGTDRCYFDGQGYTISNFVASSINENEPNCCGLFGRSSGDSITIKNLNIDNATYTFNHVASTILNYDGNPCSAVGGIYAVIDKNGIVIENCHVTNIRIGASGSVMSGDDQTDFYASGIVGLVHNSVIIRNCSVGSVIIDNTYDASNKSLVVQFGPAIGRIDVGNSNGSNTYQKAGDRAPIITVDNFIYDQGNTTLIFDANLKNIRYGGIVANITRGGVLVINNSKANHNARVYKPTEAMYCGGLIGCNKVGLDMGIWLDPNCVVSGNIDNQAIGGYNGSYQIERYIANGTGHIVIMPGGSTTCVNTLTVSGKTSSFKTPTQHL